MLPFVCSSVELHVPVDSCRNCAYGSSQDVYYRKRGSVSYIVRDVHSVRERERDTERERRK